MRGLAVLAASVLLAAGSAAGAPQATRSGNLIVNGSFERGMAGDGMELVDIPGWTTVSRPGQRSEQDFTVVRYGAPAREGVSPVWGEPAAFPSRGATRASGGQFLFGGPWQGGYELRQRLDLSEYGSLIDDAKAYALFSAEAVHLDRDSQLEITAHFYDAAGKGGPYPSLSAIWSKVSSSPPRMVAQTRRTELGRGTRVVEIVVRYVPPRLAAPFWVRAYVDNIRFEISSDPKAKPTAGGEPATPKLAPRITLTPSVIARGEKGTLRGTGWRPGHKIEIKLGTRTQKAETIQSFRTTAQGTFRWIVKPTMRAESGVYFLLVCQDNCKLRARTRLVITP